MQKFLVKYYKNKAGVQNVLQINKTRQQMSDEIGVSIKTVNRSIKKLKEENLISLTKGKIYINQSQYLKLFSMLKELEK